MEEVSAGFAYSHGLLDNVGQDSTLTADSEVSSLFICSGSSIFLLGILNSPAFDDGGQSSLEKSSKFVHP